MHPDPMTTDTAPPPRAYRCQCGRPVFFRNSECLACHTPLGFDPDHARLLPLAPGPQPDTWLPWDEPEGRPLQRCANFHTAAGCNWMVPVPEPGDPPPPPVAPAVPMNAVAPEPAAPEGADGAAASAAVVEAAATDPALVASAQAEQAPVIEPGHAPVAAAGPLCRACALNRTIPDLSVEGNADLWRRIELAKRRLVSQLLLLGLPVQSRTEDPARGLAFDLLRAAPDGPRVMTGHASGVITLNVEEADDAVREKVRADMREPYRTLLGHFRHEIGHYYWDRLVLDSPWLEPFRTLFGDEREDYAAALQRHYQNGPAPDWPLRFVSSYGSTHPWEDWAESWAHYLHMVDTVDTARSFGVNAADVDLDHEPFGPDALWQPDAPDAQAFLDFVNDWIRLTAVFNELSRSMGQHDFYPFVLPAAAVGKLQFIHQVVQAARAAPAASSVPMAPAPMADNIAPDVPAARPTAG